MNKSSMAIQIENVSKKYGKYTVLDNLSLRVGYGEIYGFLGLNGAGKTTTIKMRFCRRFSAFRRSITCKRQGFVSMQ